MIDIIPIIPVTIIYLYLIINFEKNEFEVNAESNESTVYFAIYWRSLVSMIFATISVQSIAHFVVILFGVKNCTKLISVLFIISGFLLITSNFQIQTKFTLPFINMYQYLSEAMISLYHGTPTNQCQGKQIPLLLYRLQIKNPNFHFNRCLQILFIQAIVFRVVSAFSLRFYCRINIGAFLFCMSKKSSSFSASKSNSLNNVIWPPVNSDSIDQSSLSTSLPNSNVAADHNPKVALDDVTLATEDLDSSPSSLNDCYFSEKL